MSTGGPLVEIAVQDARGARAAVDAGADRLELCQALAMGGLTPSLGLLEAVLDVVDPSVVNVLVRPRGGGFVYTDDEVAVVEADIRHCVARGVGGVVIGALTATGGVDERALDRWRGVAGSAAVVFHRAIDVVPDPAASVDRLAALGIDRILTSGGATRAPDGAIDLERMVRASAGRIEIMAGGGVLPADIPALLATGVDAVHLSARRVDGEDAPSGPGGGEPGHDATDVAVVEAVVRATRTARDRGATTRADTMGG